MQPKRLAVLLLRQNFGVVAVIVLAALVVLEQARGIVRRVPEEASEPDAALALLSDDEVLIGEGIAARLAGVRFHGDMATSVPDGVEPADMLARMPWRDAHGERDREALEAEVSRLARRVEELQRLPAGAGAHTPAGVGGGSSVRDGPPSVPFSARPDRERTVPEATWSIDLPGQLCAAPDLGDRRRLLGGLRRSEQTAGDRRRSARGARAGQRHIHLSYLSTVGLS